MSGRDDPAGVVPGPRRAELVLAAALALAAGLLYALTFQKRYYGDGAGLVSLHVLGIGERYYHVLYLPLCDFLQGLFRLDDPFAVTRLLSFAPAGLGVGATYLVLRSFAAPVFGSLAATCLMALSPALWFFGTTVEVHALVFATVAVVALLTLHAPWRSPVPSLALVTLAFPLLFLAHQTAFVLGPGWVLLVQYARARRAPAFSWRMLVFGVGPLLLAALLVTALFAGWARFGSFAGLFHELTNQLSFQADYDPGIAPAQAVWRNGWLLPLGVLVPLALAGAPRLRSVPWRASAIGLLVVLPTAFFLWWGVSERGGFFLGQAPFLLVPVALLLGRASRAKVALVLVLLALQGGWAHHRLRAYDTGWDPAERVAQARAALGARGLLLGTTGLAPWIECQAPGLEELSLTRLIRNGCKREGRLITPDEAVALARPILEHLLDRREHVALDLGYARLYAEDPTAAPTLVPHLAAIEAFIRERYVVREEPHPYWPMLVLERKR